MRIDSHQHYWDPEAVHYFWMPEEHPVLRRRYTPLDLDPILTLNKFDGSVVVQAAHNDAEADWLLALADQHRSILGVVAWADLRSKNLPYRLDQLQKHPRFCGIRHLVQDEEDEEWLLQPAVLDGLRELERRDIAYDLLLYPEHLRIVPELCAKLPRLRLVIDHLAKPYIKEKQFEPWARDIETAAQHPGLHVKLSGMVTEADHENWSSDDLLPYVQHVLRCFGADRCMFGSDWPVCLLAASWKEVLAGFTQAHGAMPAETRAKLLGETAQRFYRLQI
jgi:L-fuconolactonase